MSHARGATPAHAAQARSAARPVPLRRSARAYPLVDLEADHGALVARLAATRALLAATSPHEVVDVVATFIRDLGGVPELARLTEDARSLPLDVSFGLSEPVLPTAEPVSVAAMRLSAALPELMEDAHRVLSRLRRETRRHDEAERDVLTGLLTRRAWMRRLGSARPGDGVCLIDLDRFKAVNDTRGHAAGDAVLRAFGTLLMASFREQDSCGRYGGDELAVLAPGLSRELLAVRVNEARREWAASRPPEGADVGLSAGVATVDEAGPSAALRAADSALYRAKKGGRGRTAVADSRDR